MRWIIGRIQKRPVWTASVMAFHLAPPWASSISRYWSARDAVSVLLTRGWLGNGDSGTRQMARTAQVV